MVALKRSQESSPQSILPYHDSRFDFVRTRAHQFALGSLGLKHAIGPERVAIIHEDNKAAVAQKLGIAQWPGAGYEPYLKEAVVTAIPDEDNPTGTTQSLVSKTIHEITHSATADVDELDEHTFWREALAGMGEAAYLQDLQRQQKRQAVSDFVIKRAGVDLWVPGAFRYYDSSTAPGANSSQALVAASGFAVTQKVSGMKASTVLNASIPGDRSHYGKLKSSFEHLKPGLTKEIDSFPQTTEGIIQATAVVHDEGRKQGIIPQGR